MNKIMNILPPVCILLAVSGCEQALDAHANAEAAYNARVSQILGVEPVDVPPEPFELSRTRPVVGFDQYGRPVHADPGAQIRPNAYGPDVHSDQFGRPVRCQAQMGQVFC